MLIDTFVPSGIYNALSHINEVSDAPDNHANDLEDLRNLLTKHNAPRGISVRLIHKHFDTLDGGVMVFEKVTLEKYGTVQIM